MNQFTEAATKLEEAAAILRAVTIPPMTTRGLPTPEPVEPQAGQVWADDGGGQVNPCAYILQRQNNGWQAVRVTGYGYWGAQCELAADAVRGLTYAAPSVAAYYQAELRSENERLSKRVAELEAQQKDWFSPDSHATFAIRALRFALDGPEPLSESEAVLVGHMRARIQPALAKAREEAAQAAREERFVAINWFSDEPNGFDVYDQVEARFLTGPLITKTEARTVAARLNAECAKEVKP